MQDPPKIYTKCVPLVEFVYLNYLLTCQVRVTGADSGLCCVHVTSVQRQLTPLFSDSVIVCMQIKCL